MKTNKTTELHPVIDALVRFAEQHSGINRADYGFDRNGAKLFAEEVADISRHLTRFREVLESALAEGVTDAHVIAEAKRRLTWDGKSWHYTTGQYFPTEYRPAATAVLKNALHNVRANREPERRKVKTIADLKELNAVNGGSFFDPDTLHYFNSVIETGIIHGAYFITSERMNTEEPKAYTIRTFNDVGGISDIGEFGEFHSLESAQAALETHTNHKTV